MKKQTTTPDRTGEHRTEKARAYVARFESGGEGYGTIIVRPLGGIMPQASVAARFDGACDLSAGDDTLRCIRDALNEHLGERVDHSAIVDIIERLRSLGTGGKADAESVANALRQAIGGGA
jgi:hypothetical protein